MNSNWIKVSGHVKPGYQVASGRAKDSPYPRGTIDMQIPFFQALGLELNRFFPGTLNISIQPHRFQVKQPAYTFRQVKWNPDSPAEDFSFSPVMIGFQEKTYAGLLYYPHPETKPAHFQDHSTLEVLAPWIEGIEYGMPITVELNSKEIDVLID